MPWELRTIARRWQIFTLMFFQRSTSAKMLKKLFVESPTKSKLLAWDIYSSVDKLNQTLIILLCSLTTLLSFADTFRVPIQLSCYGSELALFYIPHLIFSISIFPTKKGSIDYVVFFSPITDLIRYFIIHELWIKCLAHSTFVRDFYFRC